MTPLHYAAKKDPSCVELLIEADADINALDADKRVRHPLVVNSILVTATHLFQSPILVSWIFAHFFLIGTCTLCSFCW